jgi:hypothetical protein
VRGAGRWFRRGQYEREGAEWDDMYYGHRITSAAGYEIRIKAYSAVLYPTYSLVEVAR